MPQDLAADQSTFDLTPPTDEQFQALVADLDEEEKHVLLEHGTEAPFCGVFLDREARGRVHLPAVRPAVVQRRDQVRKRHRLAELHPAVRGGASRGRSATPATAWSAPRSSARAAERTRATSFPTGRRRPASAIASTRSASSSRPRGSRCPTSSSAARRRANQSAELIATRGRRVDSFDYLFSFYGLLLGIAVANVAIGFADMWRDCGKIAVGYCPPLLGRHRHARRNERVADHVAPSGRGDGRCVANAGGHGRCNALCVHQPRDVSRRRAGDGALARGALSPAPQVNPPRACGSPCRLDSLEDSARSHMGPRVGAMVARSADHNAAAAPAARQP